MRIRPTSGARRDPEGVEVVLVETDDWAEVAASLTGTGRPAQEDPREAADVADDDAAPERPPRHSRRWYAWRTAAAAVVTVLLVMVLNVVEVRRHEARIAALGELAGFLDPMGAAPVETWRVAGRYAGQAEGMALVSDGDLGQVQALDPLTGSVVWAVTGEAGSGASRGYCTAVDESLTDPTAAAEPLPAPRPSDGDVVACLGDPLPAPEGPAMARAVVWFLDAQTGEQLGSHSVGGSLVLADPVERDLLVGSVMPDGRLTVVRLDPVTGGPRWTYTSPDAMFGRDPLMIQSLDRRGDALVVGALSGEVALSVTTGAPLDPEDVATEPARHEVTYLPDGGTAVWQARPGASSGIGRVVDHDGRRAYGLTGPVQRAGTRDASLPKTLVLESTSGTRLRGVNLRTGRQLWSAEVGPASPLVQALGVMVLGGPEAVQAVDLRDGSILWTADRDPAVASPGLSDGEVVLVAQREDGRQILTARALSDGTEVWRAPLPDGTTSILQVGGRLVAQTGDAVVGLG